MPPKIHRIRSFMKRLSEKDYNFIFSNAPRLCIDLLINYNTSILLGRRNHAPYFGMWALPGGRLFFGESIEDGIKRIAREEVRCNVLTFQLESYCEYFDEIKLAGRHSVSLIFSTRVNNGPSLFLDKFSELNSYNNVRSNIVTQHERVIEKYLLPNIGIKS